MAPGVVNGDQNKPLTPEPQIEAAINGSTTNGQADKAAHTSSWHLKTNAPYKSATASLVDRYIDEPRSLRVAVIGGGLAGIVAGILLPVKVPGIELTIFEKNSDFVSLLYYFSRLQVTHAIRAVLGWKMSTLVSDATFRLMSTNPLLSQNTTGATNSLPVQKSETTGNLLHVNMMCTG